jgi:general transcription factor 3C polypeptide 5 (transcription factor C subunit 1)
MRIIVKTIKEFKLRPGVDSGPNVDIIPPPLWTHNTLPFNYFYAQNPYVKAEFDEEVGETRFVNSQAPNLVGYFLKFDHYPVPTKPQSEPDMTDPEMVGTIREMAMAMEERPIWTRRSLINRIRGKIKTWNTIKRCIGYIGYQFKAGPWRDALIKYGIDPRSDPKYRIYQTLIFKLRKGEIGKIGKSWREIRSSETQRKDLELESTANSHMFDGKSYFTDGKVWQVCDITDPLIVRILENAPLRDSCEISNSGWFHQGTWGKVKAIMKCKMMAIQFNRPVTEDDFRDAVAMRDETPPAASTWFRIPLPNLRLTQEELAMIHGKRVSNARRKKRDTGYTVRLKQGYGGPVTPSVGTPSQDASLAAEGLESLKSRYTAEQEIVDDDYELNDDDDAEGDGEDEDEAGNVLGDGDDDENEEHGQEEEEEEEDGDDDDDDEINEIDDEDDDILVDDEYYDEGVLQDDVRSEFDQDDRVDH